MLNFSSTRGYGTGGTVHIVVNNQIGFTTSDLRDYRSSLYCTDIFKMIEAPIFHVNGDDPEAVAFVTKIAMEYRQEFRKDVVIDLVCFRKLGHNEQDEPMVTQPLMYKKIAQHPGTRKVYADKLVAQGVCTEDEPDEIIANYRDALDRGELLYNPVLENYTAKFAVDWSPHVGQKYTDECKTAVPLADLKKLSRLITTIPENFTLQSRVQKIIDDRRLMGEGKLDLDWGMGENLAYATLLMQGFGVRVSGEDVGRGTFFHRHAVLHDQNREKWDDGNLIPLQHLDAKQAPFIVIDSVLSEEAVMAFEYGYSTAEPNELVVWEAQFGDFANGAQVVIDQFICSGEAKWGRLSGLTLLLPHGYEGQGPEHSSARIERFMNLSAEQNWQVCIPTSASQIFHLLRRQMLRKVRKPLIVITPKSLLRHKDAASPLAELAEGTFNTVLGEAEPLDPKKVTRVVLCSGKVLLRSDGLPSRAKNRQHRSGATGAGLSLPRHRLAGRTRKMAQSQGGGLVPGRAAQSGLLALAGIAPSPRSLDGRRTDPVPCQPPRIRIACRWLLLQAQCPAEGSHRRRFRQTEGAGITPPD